MAKLDNILVYHWQAWEHFLISHLVADYCHVEAQYEDDIAALEKRLTPNIRAVLFQINISHSFLFPAQRRQLIAALRKRHILVLNTEVEDISKRHLHHLLEKAGLRSARATQAGPADQLLFIKSNFNSGGETDLLLPQALRMRLLPPQPATIQRWSGYYTLRRSDISSTLWADQSIVIENYIGNAENSFYRVYGFGDAIVLTKAFSNHLIKKLSGHPDDMYVLFNKAEVLDQTADAPLDLLQTIAGFITHYPLAYFCLDIVHDSTQHTIIDLNLTPYSGTEPEPAEAIAFLRKGAHGLIKRQLQASNFVLEDVATS